MRPERGEVGPNHLASLQAFSVLATLMGESADPQRIVRLCLSAVPTLSRYRAIGIAITAAHPVEVAPLPV